MPVRGNPATALAAALMVVVISLGVSSAGAASPHANVVRACPMNSLRVTVQNGDGLHHGVEVLRFANVGAASCELSGYPTVEAILDSTPDTTGGDGIYRPSPAGSVKKASDAEWSWAGGVDANDVPPKVLIAPVVVLAPRDGVATSTLNWVDGPNGKGTCPAFNDLEIRVDGGSVRRFVRAFEPLCYEFVVTPIVAGASGSMFVRADYSKAANDLVLSMDIASGMRSDADTLRREWADARRFSFRQRMRAAENLQQYAQVGAVTTPWSVLNSLLSSSVQESQTLGSDAVITLTQPNYERTMDRAYVKFHEDMSALEKVLGRISGTSVKGFERRF